MWSEIVIGLTISFTVIFCNYIFQRLIIPFLFDLKYSRKMNKRILEIRNILLGERLTDKYRYDSELEDCYSEYVHENGMTYRKT